MTDLVHLHHALVTEVRCLYWAEKQLHAMVAKLLAKPHAGPVPDIIPDAGRTAINRRWRLERVFSHIHEDISSRRCPRMTGILEGRMPPADRILRASGHLSALYSTAAARARALGYTEVAFLLDDCLSEVNAVTPTAAVFCAPAPTGEGGSETSHSGVQPCLPPHDATRLTRLLPRT